MNNKVILKIKSFLLFVIISLCMMGCGNISDGEYTASVVLTGGSGKAYIESPCRVIVTEKEAVAHLIWSSSNYDYMISDGVTYYPVNTEGNSEFEIPVRLGEKMEIMADTTAMSSPHLISYQLLVSIDNSEYPKATNAAKEYEVSSKNAALTVDEKSSLLPPEIKGLTYVSTDTNYYAECFKIHRYKDGYVVICVEDGRNYLLIPEAKESPAGLNSDIIPLSMPLDRLYLATSGAMCHFDILGAVDAISMSGIEEKDWYIESAKKAMESGTISYGGKYSAPDYEQIVLKDIDLAIENTMILHVPKVLEKLEKLGIPVFIDRSSYESVPLGRCEWIMVYGVLLGKEKEAKEAFVAQKRQVDELKTTSDNSKTVAFFSINSNHQIVTRSSDDYFARMISMGGGRYLAPPDDKNGNSSQMTISIEAFYDYARDADILLYNATIEEAPASIYELLQKEDTLTDYKAFNTGNVYVADKSIYQYANETGTIISNLNSIITGEKEETDFFHKIR